MGTKQNTGLQPSPQHRNFGTASEPLRGRVTQAFPGHKTYDHRRHDESPGEPVVLGRPVVSIPGIIPDGITIVTEPC